MKEKLQEYALIAEIIGGVGIIASLIFVGVQVNQGAEETAQNTRQMQADAYQQLTTEITALNRINIEHPRIGLLAYTAGSLDELSPEDVESVSSFIIMIIRFSDLAYHQYEQGIIPEELFRSAVGPLSDTICRPAYRQIWTGVSRHFVAGFQDYVNGLITLCRPPEPRA